MVETNEPFRHWNEKDFLGFVIDFVVETNADGMYTNIDKLSKHMSDMPPKCPANLYRK
jgi:hypothetical protein